MKKKSAFTLIELLVVVSIIALLVSILMPALGRARDQAKLVSDAANCRQIAMIMGLHQADHDGAVPVLYNRYVSNIVPAKYCYLSLALQDYTDVDYGEELDPYETWQHQGVKYQEYCEKVLPEFFNCPFARGHEYGTMSSTVDQIEIRGETVDVYKNEGANEHYTAWGWAFKRGEDCYIINKKEKRPDNLINLGRTHPLGLPHGTPKYGTQVWHSHYKKGYTEPYWYTWNKLKDTPIKWDSRDASMVGASGPAEVAVLMCGMGEFTTNGVISDYAIYNYGSHARGTGGGTNAVFADCHVEWVEGSQIGWQ